MNYETITRIESGIAAGLDRRFDRRLSGGLPPRDTLDHHADVRMTGIDRAPRGLMRGESMDVGAIENQRIVLLRGERGCDVVGIVG